MPECEEQITDLWIKGDIMALFDYNGFEKMYYASTRYAKKEQMSYDFHTIWWKTFGTSDGFNNYPTYPRVRALWTAPNKRTIKIKLMGVGHSSQSVDSLFKCFKRWLDAHK